MSLLACLFACMLAWLSARDMVHVIFRSSRHLDVSPFPKVPRAEPGLCMLLSRARSQISAAPACSVRHDSTRTLAPDIGKGVLQRAPSRY